LQFTYVTEARLKRTRRAPGSASTRPAEQPTELTNGRSFFNNNNDNIAAEADSLPIAEPALSLDLTGELSWLNELADSTVQAMTSSATAADSAVAATAADSAVAATAVAADGSSSSSSAWDVLRLQHGWPDGQSELESLYSPFDSEGIEGCSQHDKSCSLLL
jgi:hypothetical protein